MAPLKKKMKLSSKDLKHLQLPKPLRKNIEKTQNIDCKDVYGFTLLMYVSEDGLNDQVEKVLGLGADIDSIDNSNASALIHTVSTKKWSTALLLLDRGADPNIKYNSGNEKGFTVLMLAFRHKQVKLFTKLLEKGVDLSDMPYSTYTSCPILILAIACDCGDEIFSMLLDTGIDINAVTDTGTTVLMSATVFKRDSYIALLLAHKTQKLDINAKDVSGKTVLMSTAKHGQDTYMSILIEAGAEIDAVCPISFSALNIASLNGHKLCVDMLLEAGADVHNKTRIGLDSLMLSAKSNTYNCMYRLLKAGADVKSKDKDDRDALMIAARFGHSECISLLLSYGADPNRIEKTGQNSLSIALNSKHANCISQLIKCGSKPPKIDDMNLLWVAIVIGDIKCTSNILDCKDININEQYEHGATALMLSISIKIFEQVKLIIKKGKADVNIQDIGGNTALMLAVTINNYKIIKLLMRVGRANVDIKCSLNKTAYDTAVQLKLSQEILDELSLYCYMCRTSNGGYLEDYTKIKDGQLLCKDCNSKFSKELEYMMFGVD